MQVSFCEDEATLANEQLQDICQSGRLLPIVSAFDENVRQCLSITC
jgi:hypothetical protein